MEDSPEALREFYDEVFYSYNDCKYCGLVFREISSRGMTQLSSNDTEVCLQCNLPSEFKMELVGNVYGVVVIEWEKCSKTLDEMHIFRESRNTDWKRRLLNYEK